MTTINIATQVPSSITTLEQLAAWSFLALAAVNPQLVAIEGPGISERVAQAGQFYVPSDNKYRLLGRLSLVVSPDHLAGGAKSWTYVQELSNTALPAAYAA
jgi:hypothetical protein